MLFSTWFTKNTTSQPLIMIFLFSIKRNSKNDLKTKRKIHYIHRKLIIQIVIGYFTNLTIHHVLLLPIYGISTHWSRKFIIDRNFYVFFFRIFYINIWDQSRKRIKKKRMAETTQRIEIDTEKYGSKNLNWWTTTNL